MKVKIFVFGIYLLFGTLYVSSHGKVDECESNCSDYQDSTKTKRNAIELKEVSLTVSSKARQLKESALPVSVIGKKQLQGTANNINDVLARTAMPSATVSHATGWLRPRSIPRYVFQPQKS